MRIPIVILTLVLLFAGWGSSLRGQNPNDASNAGGANLQGAADVALQIEVPTPLDGAAVKALRSRLTQIAAASRRDGEGDPKRTLVVLRFGEAPADSETLTSTSFEDALALARSISGPDLRRLRLVAWIDAPVRGYDALPILAAETILVSPDGSIGNPAVGARFDDETIALNYGAIARRRGLFPPEIVAALADPSLELARVTTLDGQTRYAAGDELQTLRSSGNLQSESIWSVAGEPLVLSADQLRQLRAAIAIVQDAGEVADVLDVPELRRDNSAADDPAQGRLLSITGVISAERVRRWSSNLLATTESGTANTWLVDLNSPGGDLASSVSLASVLADPGPDIQTVGGYISGQARGDAAILAVATRPLLMSPESTLGGSGGDAMSTRRISAQSELINLVAKSTNRSQTLLRGLLDPTLTIYRYTNRDSGRVRYATVDELRDELGPVAIEDVWRRGEQVDLSEPLTPARAIELGLADGEAASLAEAAVAIGLDVVPPELSDRGLVRMVEKLGRSDALAFILLLIGFMMLSTEMSAPGLGLPGFVALLCFAFFFWSKFLAGTAEWLELLAFGLGIACLLIEVFVLPGFGIFGLGGMVLTVLGVVLMSQTFVIPRNEYQVNELVRGVSIAIASFGGLILGLFAVRTFLPQAALATGLSMGRPEETIEQQERIGKFDDLLGQVGTSVTPLRPSGKARFGDRLVGVISDATAIEADREIRVLDVKGNRVIVEAIDD